MIPDMRQKLIAHRCGLLFLCEPSTEWINWIDYVFHNDEIRTRAIPTYDPNRRWAHFRYSINGTRCYKCYPGTSGTDWIPVPLRYFVGNRPERPVSGMMIKIYHLGQCETCGRIHWSEGIAPLGEVVRNLGLPKDKGYVVL